MLVYVWLYIDDSLYSFFQMDKSVMSLYNDYMGEDDGSEDYV